MPSTGCCLSPSLRHSFCQCPLIVKTFNCVSFCDYMCECLCACVLPTCGRLGHTQVLILGNCVQWQDLTGIGPVSPTDDRLHLPHAEVTGML